MEPIIRFNLPLGSYIDTNEINPILEAYGHWGVNGVIFFDRPNARSSWTSSGWIQQNLVEQFLDYFLPLANIALQAGLIPILPPMEPGGSYWDTAFLRASLESLVERGEKQFLQKLAISGYAWTNHNPLNWGAGGPDRWPQARPYYSPPGEEDQRGFRIFDWYNAITQAVLGRSCPIILLGGGACTAPERFTFEEHNEDEFISRNLSLVRLLDGNKVQDPQTPQEILEPIPQEVVSCNLWLLAADPECPYYEQAWYKEDSSRLDLIQQVKQREGTTHQTETEMGHIEEDLLSDSPESAKMDEPVIQQKTKTDDLPQFIHHYLLLPTYEWGVADWHLDVIQPFVKKYRPTIGFSLEEAALSKRVTIVGNQQTFPEEVLDRLRLSGCIVERIAGDGTTIATELAER